MVYAKSHRGGGSPRESTGLERHSERFVFPLDIEHHGLAYRFFPDQLPQGRGVRHRLTVHGNDQIARFKAGTGSGAAGHHALDLDATFGGRVHGYADPGDGCGWSWRLHGAGLHLGLAQGTGQGLLGLLELLVLILEFLALRPELLQFLELAAQLVEFVGLPLQPGHFILEGSNPACVFFCRGGPLLERCCCRLSGPQLHPQFLRLAPKKRRPSGAGDQEQEQEPGYPRLT